MDEETLRSHQIEREMLAAKNKEDSKIKLLLLGAGESGKSTLFKQMRILYSQQKNFTNDEREAYISIIHGNILSDMKIMIDASATHTPIENQEAAKEVANWTKNQFLGPEQWELLDALWNDPGMKQNWKDRGDIQVQDALAFYMAEIRRVCGVDEPFVPTNKDILRSRVRTSGVVQANFRMGEAKFEMYDVGGQRNERRKWIHSFEGVTSVIFVAAVSEYNQILYEDNTVNRQDEAVELFKQQLESEWFVNVPFILFLNKRDLFREKLTYIPFKMDTDLVKRNVDYDGPECNPNVEYKIDGSDPKFEEVYDATCEYLKDLYQSQADIQHIREKRKKGIYTYFTNSTDTENVQKIMSACTDIILQINLHAGGWLTP